MLSFLSITFTPQFKFSNSCHLKTVQDINKSFGGVIDLCVYDFCECFQNFASNARAFFQDFTNSLFSQNL